MPARVTRVEGKPHAAGNVMSTAVQARLGPHAKAVLDVQHPGQRPMPSGSSYDDGFLGLNASGRYLVDQPPCAWARGSYLTASAPEPALAGPILSVQHVQGASWPAAALWVHQNDFVLPASLTQLELPFKSSAQIPSGA